MKFSGQYIYPPRPTAVIKYDTEIFRRMQSTPGWIAQIKANGQRSMEYFHPDGKLVLWNRHHESHRNYKLPDWLEAELRNALKFQPGVWNVVDGELLHAKDATVKNTFYLWDILVHNDDWRIGTTYGERHKTLLEITGAKDVVDGWKYQISEHIWVAAHIPQDRWAEMWGMTKISWVEGFVLKNLNGRLLPGFKEENNGDWMIRSRKRSESGHVRY